MEIVHSKNTTPIRLTDERWLHIVENHDDMAGYRDLVLGTVEDPDYIIKGYRDDMVALKETKPGRFLAVVYKELSATDGFIITAYFTERIKFSKELNIWQGK